MARAVTTTLNFSDAHPKQISQFISSIASAPSAPAVPERLDATHVTSSSKDSRVTVSGTSSYYSKATYVRFSMGGTRISGCFSQRTSATGRLVCVQTSPWRRHPPLSVNGPTDCLPQLYRQQGDLESMRQEILLLFYKYLDVALSGSALHQRLTHQACVYYPLPEFQSAADPRPDLP